MRSKLTHLIATLIVFAGLAPADETSDRCKMAGAIFSIDPLGGTLILKDTTGYLKNVKVSSATTISKLPVGAGGSGTPMRPTDLNSGDLVCVHGGDGDAPPKLSVVPRADVHRAQAEFLAGWQRNSLYGTLSAIDVSGRTFTVTPLPPSTDKMPVRVSLPATVQLKTAPSSARRVSESVAFRLEDLKAGEPVYVRGTRQGTGPEMTASLVLKDGYRGILGSLAEVQVLASVLKIVEYGTGRTLSIKIAPGQVYRTTENITHPMRVETASGVVVVPVGLADIQPGDAILVIGRTTGTGETADGTGLAAVMKFGTFGVLPKDPKDHVGWAIAK